MRVGKVAGHENLMRLHFLEQVLDNVDVALRKLPFLDGARFIERKAQKMDVIGLHAYVVAGDGCLGLTYHRLNFAYFLGVHISGRGLRLNEITHIGRKFLVLLHIESEHRSNLVHHHEIAQHILVAHGDVA